MVRDFVDGILASDYDAGVSRAVWPFVHAYVGTRLWLGIPVIPSGNGLFPRHDWMPIMFAHAGVPLWAQRTVLCPLIVASSILTELANVAVERFPAWLGKMSSTNKNTRLLQELNTHMLCTGEYHGTPLSMRMDFVPTLRALLSAPLRDRSMGPEEAVQQVLEKLDSYSLTKDDFDTLMGEFQLARGRKKDALEGVESKTKAALTRQYNAGGHHMKSSVMMKDGVTKGKKRKIKAEANPDRAGDNDVVAMDDAPPDALEEDDEDSDGDAIAGLISKRGKGKGKGKGKAAAKKPKKAKK